MRTVFNPLMSASRISGKVQSSKLVKDKFAEAVKKILNMFEKTNEIGRIDEPIIVKILNPLKDSKISEAKLKIESPRIKDDYRSRVLSMIAESEELGGGISVVLANGTKFAIESTLKNPNTIEQFKNFIRQAEKDFVA